MAEDEMTEQEESVPRRHRKPDNRMFVVRNILNTLFIFGALGGVVCYMKFDRSAGTYIIICSMALKFIESALRLLKV